MFQKNLATTYFVELKTDQDSFRPEQLCDLLAARKAGIRSLLYGVKKICKATDKKVKYVHFLHQLKEAGLICFQDDIYGKHEAPGQKNPTWEDVFCSIKLCEHLTQRIEIVYITPDGQHPNEKDCKKVGIKYNEITRVGFDCVADIVAARGGFGPMFAYYLKRWENQAGEMDPRKIGSAP